MTTEPDGVAGLDEASQQSTLSNTSAASGDDVSSPSTPRSRKEPEVEENPWKGLTAMDLPDEQVIYGENSHERKIQAARESSTLQAL